MKKWLFLMIIAFIGIFALLYPKKPSYKNIVKLTKFSEPAYSVFWYEPRIRLYQKALYLPYPEMPPCDRLEFIYKLKGEDGSK